MRWVFSFEIAVTGVLIASLSHNKRQCGASLTEASHYISVIFADRGLCLCVVFDNCLGC